MNITHQLLNEILVNTYHQITFKEEQALKEKLKYNINVKNIHILQAIYDCCLENSNSMNNVAKKLKVTAGTLTTSIKGLEKQGYITKTQSNQDKRIFYLNLTSKGQEIVNSHMEFHKSMVDFVVQNLGPKEQANLIDLLSKVKFLFSD